MKHLCQLFNKYLLFTLLIPGLFACSDDPEVSPASPEDIKSTLVSKNYVFKRKAADIQGFLSAANIDLNNDEIIYDVSMYKVEYKTLYGDQEVTASGIVLIPEEAENPGFFSFQHGTVASDAEVPSRLALSDTQLLLYSAIAGRGMITVVPDFIGFGSSSDLVHPYYVEQPSANAVIDNIRAAAEIAMSQEIEFSPDLYLAGYSQGGYVTMAAHKAIELEGLEYFNLKASFPASGGYEIEGVRDFFFDQEIYDNPFFMGFVAEAYRNYYNKDTGFLSLFFQEPYATNIPEYYTGDYSGNEINEFLTDTVAHLINPEYISDTSNPKYDEVNIPMQENSLTDWTPTIPVYMFHGDADITVPYQNSVDSYETFIENGASTKIVTFTTIPEGTHGSAVFPYLLDISEKLSNLQKEQ